MCNPCVGDTLRKSVRGGSQQILRGGARGIVLRKHLQAPRGGLAPGVYGAETPRWSGLPEHLHLLGSSRKRASVGEHDIIFELLSRNFRIILDMRCEFVSRSFSTRDVHIITPKKERYIANNIISRYNKSWEQDRGYNMRERCTTYFMSHPR